MDTLEVRRSTIYRLIKLLILIAGITFTLFILFYNQIIPQRYTTLSLKPNEDNFISATVRAISPALREHYTTLTHVAFATAYLVTTFVSISAFPGRSAWEILLLFFVFIIPRPRKKWGIVYDRSANKPIPFTVINIEKVENGSPVFIKQVVADLDGRYRATLSDIQGKILITIKAEGYQDYQRTMVSSSLLKEADLAVDIPMASLNGAKAQFKSVLNQMDFYNNSKMFYLVYVVSFIPWLISLSISGFVTQSFLGMAQLVIYTTPIVWNTFILYKRHTPNISTLNDELTHQPLQGAIVQIFDINGRQLESIVTNARGILNFRVSEGKYCISIYKENYDIPESYLEDGNKLIPVTVDSGGYLTESISLKRSAQPEAELTQGNLGLINPFN